MSLLRTNTSSCTVCGSEVERGDGGSCPQCDAVFHAKCLADVGKLKRKSRLIRDDKIELECPDCGAVNNW